ncbi:Asp-domain-containing protein [Aulographum hederae CBS 113979]|uniref:Asp-domain-containing protein n=1 Tax=Aulographum hederae CBS 113979 TaxID=1176131 RepID=A0A6G1HBE2_9PEZI|nr:Asp-domain-containing protein [Aulographum hederae CBS 113979]
MPSFSSIAAFTGLASLALATPVDLQKRSEFSIKQVAHGSKVKSGPISMQKTLLKYSKPVPEKVAAAAAAAASGSVEASPEQYDSEYLCPVSVGGTTLMLDFDTGSADLWVFSSLMPKSEQSGHAVYSASSTKVESGKTWKISYGDGSGASGKVYADKVVIGGVTATSQAVEAATSVSSQFQQDTNNDGLVGLAFSSINTVSPTPATTFFDTVKSSLAQALFAVTLKSGTPGTYDFGYIDDSKYTGDITYVDVDDSQGFWEFTADGYAIGGGSAESSSIDAIADTGTSLLYLDPSIVEAYWGQVDGAQLDNSQGGYTFPCDADLPDFSLVIGGSTQTAPGAYMNFAPVDSSTCFGGLQENTDIGLSIVGDVFLKSQYVVFSMESGNQLGWAQQA